MTSRMEKLVAAMLLCCMAVFWVAIAPDAVPTREADAKASIPKAITVTPPGINQPAPKLNTQTPQISEPATKANKPSVDSRAKARRAYKKRMARIERLKQRRRDSPAEARKRMVIGLEDRPDKRGEDRRALTRFEDIPDLPVLY